MPTPTTPKHTDPIRRALTGAVPALVLLLSVVTYGYDELVIIREIRPVAELDWLVLEEGDLQASNATTLGELLADVPGMWINESGTPGGLTTASIRASAASQVLVLVDGVPVNQATNGVADLSSFPLAELERVEIRRGTAGSHYGGSAVGGVVNLVTKLGVEATGDFTVGLGSAGERRYSLALGHGFDPALTVSARGWLAEHDGWRDNSATEEAGLRVGAAVELRGHTIRASYTLWTKEQGLPGPHPAEGTAPEFGSQESTSLHDDQAEDAQSATLNYHGYLGPVLLHADLGWREHTLDHFARYRSVYVTEDESTYVTTDYYGSVWSRFSLFEPVELEVGLDYRLSRLDARVDSTVWSSDPFDPDDPGVTSTTEWNPETDDVGGWLEAQAVLGVFSVNACGRVDDHGAFGTRFTADGGVAAVLDGVRFHLSGGTAFRPPTLNDLYWPAGGNEDLRPEEAWEAALGFAWETPVEPTIYGDLFYRETTDLIAWQPDETGLFWSPENVDSQAVFGATAGFLAGPFRAAYTYTDARQRKSEVVYSDWMTGEVRTDMIERRAAYLPAHQVSLGFDVGVINLLARWVGDRAAYYPDYSGAPEVTVTEKILPAVWTFDARAEYELARGFSFFAAVENLSDADVPAAFGNTADDRDYPRQPRRFTLGVEMAF
jgi:vitamin B12 transporter